MNPVVRAVPLGLLAGIAATVVKSKAEEVLQPLGERLLPPSPSTKAHRAGADPADHPENMPPHEMVDEASRVAGGALDEDQRDQVSDALHWVMGVGFAVAYAVAASQLPAVRAGRGTLAGAALFGVTHGSGLWLAGFQAPPTQLPRAWWVWEGGSHLAYGLAVDVALSGLDAVVPD